MRQTPGYEGPVLLVRGVALAALHAAAHAALGSGAAAPVLDVLELVAELLDGGAVLQRHGLVGQVAPVGPGRRGDQLEPRLDERRHVLGDVVPQHLAALPDLLLEVGPGLALVGDLALVRAVPDPRQVGHGVPHGAGAEGGGLGPAHVGGVAHLVDLDGEGAGLGREHDNWFSPKITTHQQTLYECILSIGLRFK